MSDFDIGLLTGIAIGLAVWPLMKLFAWAGARRAKKEHEEYLASRQKS